MKYMEESEVCAKACCFSGLTFCAVSASGYNPQIFIPLVSGLGAVAGCHVAKRREEFKKKTTFVGKQPHPTLPPLETIKMENKMVR